jgi:hypothetical protein
VFERRRIVPALSEGRGEVGEGWTANLELHVVPRGPFAITLVHFIDLRVSIVYGVVVTAVTEVDSTDKGDVAILSIEAS